MHVATFILLVVRVLHVYLRYTEAGSVRMDEDPFGVFVSVRKDTPDDSEVPEADIHQVHADISAAEAACEVAYHRSANSTVNGDDHKELIGLMEHALRFVGLARQKAERIRRQQAIADGVAMAAVNQYDGLGFLAAAAESDACGLTSAAAQGGSARAGAGVPDRKKKKTGDDGDNRLAKGQTTTCRICCSETQPKRGEPWCWTFLSPGPSICLRKDCLNKKKQRLETAWLNLNWDTRREWYEAHKQHTEGIIAKIESCDMIHKSQPSTEELRHMSCLALYLSAAQIGQILSHKDGEWPTEPVRQHVRQAVEWYNSR